MLNDEWLRMLSVAAKKSTHRKIKILQRLLGNVLCASLFILHILWFYTLNTGDGRERKALSSKPCCLVSDALGKVNSHWDLFIHSTNAFPQLQDLLSAVAARIGSRCLRSPDNNSRRSLPALRCKKKRGIKESSKLSHLETGMETWGLPVDSKWAQVSWKCRCRTDYTHTHTHIFK